MLVMGNKQQKRQNESVVASTGCATRTRCAAHEAVDTEMVKLLDQALGVTIQGTFVRPLRRFVRVLRADMYLGISRGEGLGRCVSHGARHTQDVVAYTWWPARAERLNSTHTHEPILAQ